MALSDNAQSLIDYVKTQAKMYRINDNMLGDFPKESPIRLADLYEWLIENMVIFDHGFDKEATDLELKSNFFQPKIKECYFNSMMFQSPTVEYWEGWAVGIIPMPHAWNMRDGKLIDTTWNLFKESEGTLYFGIHIPREFMQKLLSKKTPFKPANYAGPFIWDYAMEQVIKERKLSLEEFEAKYHAEDEEDETLKCEDCSEEFCDYCVKYTCGCQEPRYQCDC